MTKSSNCRICDGPAGERLVVREMMYGTREAFEYFSCAHCACLQIAEIPSDIARHYPADYYSYEDSPKRKRWFRDTTRRMRNRHTLGRKGLCGAILCAVKRPTPIYEAYGRAGLSLQGAVLDVGGGAGAHVRELRALGIRNALCVDAFIPHDVLDAGTVLAKKGSIFDIEGRFDLVTFHHSLEHMDKPRDVLATARDLLTDTGTILVRVPTVTSEAFETYGANWSDLDAPRHFYLYSHESIGILARAAGLRVNDLWCDSNAFQFWASEQYAADIPLNDPRSYARDPDRSPFTAADINGFATHARALNAELRGDSICVLLSPA